VTNITEPQTGQRTEKSLFHSKQVALGGIDIKKGPTLFQKDLKANSNIRAQMISV